MMTTPLDPKGLEAAAHALVKAQPNFWAKEYPILPNRVKRGALRIAEAAIRAYLDAERRIERIDATTTDNPIVSVKATSSLPPKELKETLRAWCGHFLAEQIDELAADIAAAYEAHKA